MSRGFHGLQLRSRCFTTGQVAKVCGVSARTVHNWIDSGQLKGYRIPPGTHTGLGRAQGAGDRRVRRADLIAFMEARGMPTDGLREYTRLVLAVGTGGRETVALQAALRAGPDGGDGSVQLVHVLDAFAAGRATAGQSPVVAVLDLSGFLGGLWLARSLRRDCPACKLVVLVPEDGGAVPEGAERFQHPFDPKLLAERVASLAGKE
jgi:excisionase family DNA binding protein